MPTTKKGYLSTSAIARMFNIERDFLFEYLQSNNILFRNADTNSFELTELGMSKGGEYQSSTGSAKWVIWKYDFINDSIFSSFTLTDEIIISDEKSSTPTNQMSINIWKQNDLIKLSELINEKKNIQEISLILDLEESVIKRKIDSLPRLRKKYSSIQNILINAQISENENIKIEVKKEDISQNPKEEYKNMIQMLADGVNPFTGEIFEYSHVCQNVFIVRALTAAAKALDKEIKKETREIQKPARAGEAWDEEEDEKLIDQFNDGTSIKDIALSFGRTVGSIRSRLLNHGVISNVE